MALRTSVQLATKSLRMTDDMNEKNYSSRMYSDYIREVEASGILTAKLVIESSKDAKSFKTSLANSRHRAITEFRACHKDLVMLFEKINEIENEISQDIRSISSLHETYNSVWHGIFENFNLQLSEIFQYASDSLIVSFRKKVKRIGSSAEFVGKF